MPHQGEAGVQVFAAMCSKLGEEQLHIEATGPGHWAIWLDTSLKQAMCSRMAHDRMRRCANLSPDPISGAWDDGSWYLRWVAEAMARCSRSAAAAKESGLKGELFPGRRTGGSLLLLLQALYIHTVLSPLFLMILSVTVRYWLLDVGASSSRFPSAAGTHAHELPMALAGVLANIDDRSGVPLSQGVGRAMYFSLACPMATCGIPPACVSRPCSLIRWAPSRFYKRSECCESCTASMKAVLS